MLNNSLIQLEILKKEYDNTLIEYEQSQQNITNSTNTLVALPNNILSGGNSLNIINNITNENDCIADCTANTSCNSAIFKSSLSECTLYSGNSTIISSINEDDYAIVSDLKSNIYKSQGLNSKLQNINKQINTYLDKLVPLTQKQITENNQSKKLLHKQYNTLTIDRSVLNKQQIKINSINNKYNDKEITTSQITTQYIIWVVFTIIVLSITIILFAVPNINILEKNPLIFLFIILLIFYFIYNYFEQFYIFYPNIDIAYNINKLNFFNY